jgi:hypothetical protein
LLLAWIVFPLVLVLLSFGCGLLLEQLAGVRLPGTMLAPSGFAVIIVAATFATIGRATATLTVPLVVALAVAGWASAVPWRGRRFDGWAAGAALGVFAVYAAPVVLSLWFDALSVGGDVRAALEARGWGDVDGTVTDRFGLTWLIGHAGGAAD